MSIPKIRIKYFQSKLIAWYLLNGRDFAWRKDNLSSYQIIVAEVLLQRTKAETVEKFYTDFLTSYPDWRSLVNAQVKTIESDLKPLGLHKQRASRLRKLAIELFERHGVLPSTRFELDKISMFGQYIANAIELQIFNRPKPLIDVNMARVLERYFGPRQLSDIRYDPYLQQLAHGVVNHPKSKILNWAILDFASLICKSRNPLCERCFLKKSCKYFFNESKM